MCACETSIVHAECWVSYFTVSQRLADCETRNMIRIALPCIVPRQSVTNVNAFQRQLSYLRRTAPEPAWFRGDCVLSPRPATRHGCIAHGSCLVIASGCQRYVH